MERVEYEKIIVQDLLNQNSSGELNLNPWYQRRSVWSTPQKAYLINTLFERSPIPTFYIRHSLDIEADKSIREVVDGQQRIRAILEYCSDSFGTKHPSYPKPVKYSELKRADLQAFKLTSLSVGYLLGATDEDVIEIFGRLNSVAKQLNEQEKRNAKYSGEFKQFCLRQAAGRLPLWRDLSIFTANAIARMDEVQFISDIVVNLMDGLSDYSAARLNGAYAQHDDVFSAQAAVESRLESVFSTVAALRPESIRDTVFSRQPLFFSLLVVLDSTRRRLPASSIEPVLYYVDGILNSDVPITQRRPDEADFITACTASTQRIKQRTIRHGFLRKQLGL